MKPDCVGLKPEYNVRRPLVKLKILSQLDHEMREMV